ncbi:MAG: GNAT family N-acetyltransferase [bacterium]|jgi:predicted N-acetyltransferase YhbS
MPGLEVRSVGPDSIYFVGTCSHVSESKEIDAAARRRLAWLKAAEQQGLETRVAFLDEKPVGFAYVMPIEISPWGPIGTDLAVLPCLWVLPERKGNGAGGALMAAAVEAAEERGYKGIVTMGFYHDFWLLPARFFEAQGFSKIAERGEEAILWKEFGAGAEAPRFLRRKFVFRPVKGKVVIDLFYNTFCLTSTVEAERVREVAGEYGESVIVNEHAADNRETLMRYEIPRAIYVNGKEIGWGYEAPRDGIREAISEALRKQGLSHRPG